MLKTLETLVPIALVVAFSAAYAVAAVRDRLGGDEPDAIEEAKRLFTEGKIDEPKLERRIEETVDDDYEAVRIVIEDVNDLGLAVEGDRPGVRQSG